MLFDPHRKTVELDPSTLPSARPPWMSFVDDVIRSMSSAGDIAAEAAEKMREHLGIANTRRSA